MKKGASGVRTVSLILLFSFLLGSRAFALYQTVFSVRSMAGDILLSNKDLRCISIDDEDTVLFVITESSARAFHEFTRNSANKQVWVSICGVFPKKATIDTPIPGGRFEFRGVTRYQKNCIRESFQIEKSCKHIEFSN